MNKTKLKTFAIWARNELMKSVQTRLELIGIKSTDEIIKPQELNNMIEIGNIKCKKSTYNALIRQLKYLGYEELIEETAYTWFNRLVALGYMDVNGYDDDKMIISTSSKITPDIMDYYMDAKFFDGLNAGDKEEIHKLKDSRDDENLYAQLVDWKCEELSEIMPFMFQKRGDYTELLFPMGILSKEGFIEKLRDVLADSVEELEENGEVKKIAPVEMIGWLYQFYNSEKREVVYNGSMKKGKIDKNYIAPATQLFTPDWIVKYIVENTLGRLALESIGIGSKLKEKWKFYIEPKEGIQQGEKLKIEEVKVLDPAMGSGHILTYSFDVLFDIYQDLGWTDKDAVLSILQNNIYGLEIDDRAGQLASFALVMKAREKFRRVFRVLKRENLSLNTLAIKESNALSEYTEQQIVVNKLKELEYLIRTFENAKELGSIIEFRQLDYEKIEEELVKLKSILGVVFDNEKKIINDLIKQSKVMLGKYDCLVENPPYMGNARMNPKLKKYIEKNYKEVKSDLFSVFFIKSCKFSKEKGYLGFMSPFVWMFIKSYEDLRNFLIENKTIISLVQLEYSGFSDATVPICTFILQNCITEKKGEYVKLSDFTGVSNQPIKTLEAIENSDCDWRYTASQKDFQKIPGSPIAYWISKKMNEVFEKSKKIKELGAIKKGMFTGDNLKFIRLHWEISNTNMFFNCKNHEESLKSIKKWYPLQKGGEFRKWYGNREYCLNFKNDGFDLKNFKGYGERNPDYYFKRGITWSRISSASFSGRISNEGFIYDDAGGLCHIFDESLEKIILAILNSKITKKNLITMNPTLNFQAGNIASLPIILPESELINKQLDVLVQQCINIAKEEWDSRETSWDFENLQFTMYNGKCKRMENGEFIIDNGDGKDKNNSQLSSVNCQLISGAFSAYSSYWTEKFVQMHKNEEELNRLFIEIYGLEDEMTPDVEPTDITLLKNEVKIIKMEPQMNTDEHELEKISADSWQKIKGFKLEFQYDELAKQFISYAVGCIMGRYSIDKEGLIIANSDDELAASKGKLYVIGPDTETRHEIENPRFIPDADGIVPIVNNMDSFDDDIVSRIVEFVKVVYGEETLEENLSYLAQNLGGKKSETARDTLRRYMTKEFYKDHLKRYKKRPIYWYMKSGKKDAFGALIYMHRYRETTIARVRTDYLLKYQEVLDNTSAFAKRELDNDELDPKERKTIEKRLKTINDDMAELREYVNEVKHYADQRIAIDLDDGVKVNYEKFGKILAKI